MAQLCFSRSASSEQVDPSHVSLVTNSLECAAPTERRWRAGAGGALTHITPRLQLLLTKAQETRARRAHFTDEEGGAPG